MSWLCRGFSKAGSYQPDTPRVYQLWLISALGRLIRDDKKLCLVAEGPNKGLADLGTLIEDGKLVPVIDSQFPLSEVPDALRYFGAGKHKGKIIIDSNH